MLPVMCDTQRLQLLCSFQSQAWHPILKDALASSQLCMKTRQKEMCASLFTLVLEKNNIHNWSTTEPDRPCLGLEPLMPSAQREEPRQITKTPKSGDTPAVRRTPRMQKLLEGLQTPRLNRWSMVEDWWGLWDTQESQRPRKEAFYVTTEASLLCQDNSLTWKPLPFKRSRETCHGWLATILRESVSSIMDVLFLPT